MIFNRSCYWVCVLAWSFIQCQQDAESGQTGNQYTFILSNLLEKEDSIQQEQSCDPLEELSDPEISLFIAILQTSQLSYLITSNSDHNITIFAPKNDPLYHFIQNAEQTGSFEMLKHGSQLIYNLIAYHIAQNNIIIDKYNTNDVPVITYATNAQNQSLTLTVKGGIIEGVGSSAAIVSNTKYSCGIRIYILDEVLLPLPKEEYLANDQFFVISDLLQNLMNANKSPQLSNNVDESSQFLINSASQQNVSNFDQSFDYSSQNLIGNENLYENSATVDESAQISYENSPSQSVFVPNSPEAVVQVSEQDMYQLQQIDRQWNQLQNMNLHSSLQEQIVDNSCDTMLDILNFHSELSLWRSALQLLDHNQVLSDRTTQITMFAPTDSSLRKIFGEGFDVSDIVNQKQKFKLIFGKHVILGQQSMLNLLQQFEKGEAWTSWDVITEAQEALQVQSLEFKGLVSLKTGNLEMTIIDGDIYACDSIIHITDGIIVDIY